MNQENNALQQTSVKPLPLYPTLGSLQDVIDYGTSKLPITDKNDLLAILAVYHNTLLDQIRSCQ